MFINKVKNIVHCLRCERFGECKVRFFSKDQVVYIDVKIDENEITLSNSVKCQNPIN